MALSLINYYHIQTEKKGCVLFLILVSLAMAGEVLIVTNMVFSPGTTPYMFGEYKVCHFSIVDPTFYDERLLKYWEKYPDKKPD